MKSAEFNVVIELTRSLKSLKQRVPFVSLPRAPSVKLEAHVPC